MADQEAAPQALSWGRNVTGRFAITVVVPVQVTEGHNIFVPLRTFVLSNEEEAALWASLGGITIASKVPELIH